MTACLAFFMIVSLLAWPIGLIIGLIINIPKIPKMAKEMYPGIDILVNKEITEYSNTETYKPQKCHNYQIENIDNLSGNEFEQFCANLLEQNGYSKVQITSNSGDQGIDILAHKDNMLWGFQCKRYLQSVGNFAVREAFSGKAFYHCDIAVVITNSTFTNKAKEYARETGILLWDKIKLSELIGNETEDKESVEQECVDNNVMITSRFSNAKCSPKVSEESYEELRHNFAKYLTSHGISLDSSWYDAFYLHRHCKEIDFFELLNIEDLNRFQYLAYEYLNKTLTTISTAKGSNISCYIRGITLLWKHIHGDETPYILYKHNQNPYY